MNTDTKRLFVVVHHRQDPNRLWANSWLDDERLEAITTTAEIGGLCQDAMDRGEPVLVHRCGWGDFQPLVCCSASVVQSAAIDGHTSVVMFGAQQVLSATPPVSPHLGQSYYWA